VELHFHSPNTPSWRGAQLKHGDNFTFTLPVTTRCRIFLENLIVAQLIKKFSSSYATRRLLTVFTKSAILSCNESTETSPDLHILFL